MVGETAAAAAGLLVLWPELDERWKGNVLEWPVDELLVWRLGRSGGAGGGGGCAGALSSAREPLEVVVVGREVTLGAGCASALIGRVDEGEAVPGRGVDRHEEGRSHDPGCEVEDELARGDDDDEGRGGERRDAAGGGGRGSPGRGWQQSLEGAEWDGQAGGAVASAPMGGARRGSSLEGGEAGHFGQRAPQTVGPGSRALSLPRLIRLRNSRPRSTFNLARSFARTRFVVSLHLALSSALLSPRRRLVLLVPAPGGFRARAAHTQATFRLRGCASTLRPSPSRWLASSECLPLGAHLRSSLSSFSELPLFRPVHARTRGACATSRQVQHDGRARLSRVP